MITVMIAASVMITASVGLRAQAAEGGAARAMPRRCGWAGGAGAGGQGDRDID
jgi:hypothetical protein